MMIKALEKQPLLAYWLLPSFERVQFNDIDVVLYVGAHRPRSQGTKDMDEVKKDPDAYLPKMDVSIFTYYNTTESWPVYARSMATTIAGITLLHDTMHASDRTLAEKSEFLMKMWASRNDLYSPYIEFDPNKIRFIDTCKHAESFGPPVVKFNLNDPLKRTRDIAWLKGSEIIMKRPRRKERNKFILDMIVIGKDIKRNEIVLGLKKSIRNYTRIIPLHDNGVNFVSSIRYMTMNKPTKYPLVAPTTIERLVQEHADAMKNIELVQVDFMLTVPEVLEALERDGSWKTSST